MRKILLRVLPVSVAMSLCLIFSASDIFAQCGLPGTPPCADSPGKVVLKQKIPAPIKKRKPSATPAKNAAAAPKRSAMFARLLGKWLNNDTGQIFYLTFQSNGTGFLSTPQDVCERFNFTLFKNILRLDSKATGKCNDDPANGQRFLKMMVKFDKTDRMGTNELRKNGSPHEKTEWFERVNQ